MEINTPDANHHAPDAFEEPTQSNPDLVDIGSFEKFRYDGKEYSRDDLKSHWMRQEDYTRKTQELARERDSYETLKKDKEFDDNLLIDLEKVLRNPSLTAEFRQVYPEKYHRFLDYMLQSGQTPGQTPTQSGRTGNTIDPIFEKRLTDLEHSINDARAKATDSQISSIFEKMTKKYSMASEEVVIARAQALIDKGVKFVDEQGNQIEDTWDKLWKSVNEGDQKRYDGIYKSQVDKQKLAHSKGRDIAPGGGIPTTAPKRMTLKEASEAAIAHFESQGR